MDFSFFDASYDGVFVLNQNNEILYCNEAAAQLCSSSVRRLSKGKSISEVIDFENSNALNEVTSWTEIKFKVLGKDKSGTIQIASQFFEGQQGRQKILTLHDVTLEETLHRKYQGELEQKEGMIEELRQAKIQLERYSKNLEKMVEERAGQLKAANQMLSAIMDSLGQGFLVFGADGRCSSIFTRACLEILETSPAGEPITKVLKLDAEDAEQFKNWMQISFSETLPFESLKDLAPQVFQHSEDKHVTLDYFPIRNEEDKISQIVLVATDRTVEYQTNIELEKERAYAKMILKAVSSREQFSHFLNSALKTIQHLDHLAHESEPNVELIFRVLHTLEGEAGAFSVEELRLAARDSQQYLQGSDLNRFRDSLKQLRQGYDHFIDANSSWLKAVKIGGEQTLEVSEAAVREFYQLLQQSASPHLALEFERSVLREPLIELLRHYDGVVQSVALKQGKPVGPVEFDCEGLRANPLYWAEFLSSLVHVFRNAVDHGLEAAEERQHQGKQPKGKILIHARYMDEAQSWARIKISDDGRGIDAGVLLQKAEQKIPHLKVDRDDPNAILQLIFHPGFSSRDEVGEFSGRGVGMDAVRTEAQALGGRAWVESEPGKGCHFIFELPLVPPKASLVKSA